MLRAFSLRPRWWIAVVQVVLLLVTVVMPVAAATPTNLTETQMLQLLRSYGIVKGDDNGNLNLEKPITRAEMFTIIVRAMGAEEQAKLYKGLVTFADAQGHWAEGYIAYASINKIVKGDGNGLVRPNANISYAEALTLIVRLAKRENNSLDWPYNVLFAANDLGILPSGMNADTMGQPAVRGQIFGSLAKALTSATLENGKTILQTYVDAIAPALTIDAIAATTIDATVRVTGTVQDATTVWVNGKEATLSGSTFSADASLELGSNTIKVEATDLAGNTTSKEASITRNHPVSSLEITGPARVRPGGTNSYTVVAKDQAGKAISLTGVVAKTEGNIGSFNLATGVLTAAQTPSKGKIVLTAGQLTKSFDVEVMGKDSNAARLMVRPINGGRAVSYTKPMTVQVEIQDNLGRFLDTDYGRPVTLSLTGATGITVNPLVAYSQAGVATFTVTTTAMASVNLQAASDGLEGFTRVGEFGSNLRVQLSSDPGNLLIGGTVASSRIRATLVDENGNVAINNTGNDILIQIATDGYYGSLIDPYIRILRGTSSSNVSGDEGIFTVGATVGSTAITGSVTSGQTITVDATTVSATMPTVGAGSKWDLVGSVTQSPGAAADIMIRLADANNNTVPGNYAIQLSITTSNNEPKVNGIPVGMTLTLGTTALNPVSDGIAEGTTNDGNDIIVRTASGVASFRITYNKPGQVYLAVVPAETTTTAYATDGTVGTAVNVGVPTKSFTISYITTPVDVKLEVDSDGLGEKAAVGATGNNSGRTFTLRAYLTDVSGNWVPGAVANVTLSRVSGTSTIMPATTIVATQDGKATFTVVATATAGTDVYKVTAGLAGSPESDTVSLAVQTAVPAAPAILAVRGSNNGLPGALNYLDPADTGLEFELVQDATQKWVIAKVYAENGYSPIYTSAPIDLSQVAPRIVVPKSSLPVGVTRYQVVVRNGFGDSARSASSNQVTNAVFTSNFALTSAKYVRANKTLIVYGSGFTTVGDTVNPALLTIRDASTLATQTLAGALVTVNNWSQITFDLTGVPALTAALQNPAQFSGSDVTLTAAAGWYTRTNGEKSSAITTGAPVGPLANITHAVYDPVNSRLNLEGTGFNTVTLNTAKLKLTAPGATEYVLNTFGAVRVNDSTWQFNLPAAVLTALNGNGAYTVAIEEGWAYDSSWGQTALPNAALYAQVAMASVTYDAANNKLVLTGSGFTGGTVTIGNLQVEDLSTTQRVTLSGTATVVSDSQIEFALDNAAYSVLEDPVKFQGSDIYLIGTSAWFTNAAGRPAATIPLRTLRLPQM